MSNNVFYCKSWFRVKKKPIEVWGEDIAAQKHNSGEPYTVLIGSDKTPECFIEVVKENNMVGVGFLDAHQREYLMYQFHLLENDTLFLAMAVHREFDGDSDQVKTGTTYLFKQDGNITIRTENLTPYSLEESETAADVAANYDRFPDFGHYDSLIRIER